MKRETEEGFVYDYAKLEVAGLSSLLHVCVQCECVREREEEGKGQREHCRKKERGNKLSKGWEEKTLKRK